MTTAIVNRTFRKSPLAYVGVVLGSAVLVFILAAIASGTSGGASSFFDFLIFLAVVRAVYRLFYLYTVRWTVSPDGLSVARGILPWRKSLWHAPYETIFEAYYLKSFIGHFLNYGTVGIRRAEGVTSQWQEKRMQGSKHLAGLINSGVAGHRAAMRPGAAPAAPTPAPAPLQPVIPAQSVGQDSLTDLARLKANGDITAEEYERMKARIIGA